MPPTNQIIALLQKHPCTKNDLPYRVCLNTMSMESRKSIRRIKVSGRRGYKTKCGQLQTVYYLKGDDDRAVKVFAEVNADALNSLDLSRNTVLDSGLTREMAQKVRAVL